MTCPDCIEEMVEQRRKTQGGKRIFFVCPKCGYNVRRSTLHYYEDQDREMYLEHLKERNHLGESYLN